MKKLFSLLTLALLTMSAWAANTYVKVTSTNQLVAGKKYIIVNENAGAGMGAITGGGTKFAAAIAGLEIAGNVVDIEDTDVVELTMGGQTGAYTFDMGDGAYINWKSGNSLNTTDDATDPNALWSVITAEGGYVLSNNAGAADPRILQYNSNSGQERFACYKGTQKDAVLYVQDAGAVPVVVPAAPSLPEAQTFEESLVITITNNEAGADLFYSTDGLAWNAYNGPITITETTTVYAKATLDGVDSHVVSAKYTKVDPTPEGAIVFNCVYDKGTGTNTGAPWTVTKDGITLDCTNGWVDDNGYRIYKDQTLTISSTVGNIVKIEMDGVSGYPVSRFTTEVGTWDTEGNNGTWTGSATQVVFTAGTQARATIIRVYIDGDAPVVTVEAPVFDPVNNTKFAGTQLVTITCPTQGATIYYTTDSVYQVYTQPFTINATTTVKAYAELNGATSAIVSAKYIKLVEVNTIAQANALDNKVDFIFYGNAVVAYQNGSNLWIRDASGSGLIYGNQVPALAQGTVLAEEWVAQKYDFRGGLVPEFQYPTNVKAAEDEELQTVEPFERATLELNNVNEYVIMKGQTITAETDETINNYQKYFYNADGLVFYNQFDVEFTIEDGKTYDVVGTVTVYNELPQLYIISVTEAAAPAGLRGDANGDGTVSIADVSVLIDYLLSKDESALNMANADCNLDHTVSIADVSALIDYLLSKSW